jgi:hypothetical protein
MLIRSAFPHSDCPQETAVLRKVLTAATVLIAPAALLAGLPGSAAAASAGSGGTVPPACTGVIQIQKFAFDPAAVAAGGSSTATLVARNCTAQTQDTTETWFGSFVDAAGTLPPGCPVIDPLAKPADFAPNGEVTASVGYLVFSGCEATELQITVRITSSAGVLLTQGVADLAIISPVSGG